MKDTLLFQTAMCVQNFSKKKEHARNILNKYSSVTSDHMHKAEEDIVSWYNKQTDSCENKIKELKIAFYVQCTLWVSFFIIILNRVYIGEI